MELDEEPENEGPRAPLPSAVDRLWRHPSEVGHAEHVAENVADNDTAGDGLPDGKPV